VSRSLVLLRHAWAGDRSTWVDDDRDRPLDSRGLRQAEALPGLLAGCEIEAIYSSPYRRCVQTVEYLAATRGLGVQERDELGEEHQMTAGLELLHSLLGSPVLLCGHGGLESGLVEAPRWRKGEAFLVSKEGTSTLSSARSRRAAANLCADAL
jgi:8-oxo-dGTP diphosphatase